MARQKLPPPSASSHSDTSSVDGDPSSDEEHVVSQQTPSAAKTATTNPSKRQDEDESSSEGEEEEEEEEEEVEVEVPPSKKVKLSAPPSQPPPPTKKSSSGAAQRIWGPEDEKTLLEALSDHLAQNGELPPRKDYASFLSAMNISIPFNDSKMYNKIRHMKHKYNKMISEGKQISDTTSANPDAILFQMWAELFAAEKEEKEKKLKGKEKKREKRSIKASKKRASLKIGDGSVSEGVMARDGAANGVDVAGSNSYLGQMIKNMISRQQFPLWFSTVEDVVLRIDKSKATKLEAKAMILSHDAIKLSARRLTLESEVFQTLADVMTDDN